MEPDLRKRYQSAGELLKALNACKKHLNQQRPLAERRKENAEKKESFFGVGHDLTEEEYQRRRKRAKRVSYFTGIFSVGVFAVLLFVFLWNFWLEDLFRTAERVDVPNSPGNLTRQSSTTSSIPTIALPSCILLTPRCRMALSLPRTRKPERAACAYRRASVCSSPSAPVSSWRKFRM